MMVGVESQKDPRDGLHHGGWMMKVIYWCILVIFILFISNEIDGKEAAKQQRMVVDLRRELEKLSLKMMKRWRLRVKWRRE